MKFIVLTDKNVHAAAWLKTQPLLTPQQKSNKNIKTNRHHLIKYNHNNAKSHPGNKEIKSDDYFFKKPHK